MESTRESTNSPFGFLLCVALRLELDDGCVPIVAFPQWGDQVTNAVYLVDVFKTGVRMCRGAAENRIIPKEEVKKCFVEATTGSKASELKSNALKWKAAAEAAVADGGSSERNIQAFIDEVKRRCTSTVTNHLANDVTTN
ncbi:hypothetical protein V6N13_018572 [Hibiscus sabdariffa]|uniref:Uncharacterized protein n=1 Tax=Hibiscus sabdariffa TaxID=183260 RepID=A0ABR2EP08_9ROSI